MKQTLVTSQLEDNLLHHNYRLIENNENFGQYICKVPTLYDSSIVKQFIDKKGMLKLSYFNYLLNCIPNSEKSNMEISINTRTDMYKAIQAINDELPTNVTFCSSKLSQIKIKKLYYEVLDSFSGSRLSNLNTLANYTGLMIRPKFRLIDSSHKSKNARDIKNVVEAFIKILAECIKDNDLEQVIINLYSYIFENIKYNASSYQEMLIGNLGSGELACNGISRLVFETLNKMGIQTEIRKGLSHFWNVIFLDDREITFDVTTDILLNKKYLTLGNSTLQHIQNTSQINFYSADFDSCTYDNVKEYKFNHAQEIPIQ